MGLDVTLTTNPALPVILDAAMTRGLQAGGELILLASDVLAPVEEGEPRHGVHGVETGFVRPETAGADPQVAVGYEAYWMVWQEVKDEYHHEKGQAHFLESAFLATSDLAFEEIAVTIRAELDA